LVGARDGRRVQRRGARARLRPLRRGYGVLAVLHARSEQERRWRGSGRPRAGRVTPERPETMVRMGELIASGQTGMTLVALGLGSCIGLVLLERARPLAGLAHIVLPDSNGATDAPVGKFADRAVPALLEQMRAVGATASRLEAILVGGSQM